MTIRSIATKVVLPLVLAGAIALAATSAGATDEDKSKPKHGQSVLWDEIQDGKAKEVKRPGRPDRHTTAVWDGCKFHYLKTTLRVYQGTSGAMGEVSSDPDPMPAKDKKCVDRDPTPEEMADSQARVAKANAGEQGPDQSLFPPPTAPSKN